jgi:hypothetical protein
MSLATFYIQKTDQADDVITIQSCSGSTLFSVKYSPNDTKTVYRFMMDRRRTLEYVYNMLDTLSRDTDPFDRIQLTTRVAPSVVYHISDLNDEDVCDMLMDTLVLALDTKPEVLRDDE